VKHIDSWFAFARKLGLGIEQMEEIILVTGCDRTRSWTNVAFLGGQADAQVSFGVRVEGLVTLASTSNSHLRTLGELCYAMGLKGRYVCTPFETINEFETALARPCAH
jgi:hypothetical protein